MGPRSAKELNCKNKDTVAFSYRTGVKSRMMSQLLESLVNAIDCMKVCY